MHCPLMQRCGIKDAADTEAEDIHHHGSSTSLNGPVNDAARITRRAHKSRATAGSCGESGNVEDADRSLLRCPADFDEVRIRLQAGQYSSIVCILLLRLDLLAAVSV